MNLQHGQSSDESTEATIVSAVHAHQNHNQRKWEKLKQKYNIPREFQQFVRCLLAEIENHDPVVSHLEIQNEERVKQLIQQLDSQKTELRELRHKTKKLQQQKEAQKILSAYNGRIITLENENINQLLLECYKQQLLKKYKIKEERQKLGQQIVTLKSEVSYLKKKLRDCQHEKETIKSKLSDELKDHSQEKEKWLKQLRCSQVQNQNLKNQLEKIEMQTRRQVQVIEDFQQRAELLSIQHKESQQRFLRRHKAPKDIESMRELSTKNRPTTK